MTTNLQNANELRARERNEIFTRAEKGSTQLKLLACISLALIEGDEDYKLLGFKSINEYAISASKLSKGTVSKMLDAGRDLIASGFLPETPQEELPEVSYSRINLARTALGDEADVAEVLAHALTLTESQLITTRHAKAAGEHEPSFMEICTVCKVSKAEHD